MPTSPDILTDDYVAELLAKEANDCSLKYSAMGLDAYKPDKRPANQPKPNTRFLNNIIRDTNSHNRALLARENAESRARLRELEETDRKKRHEEERKEQRSKPGPSDTRKRMLGDIAAILGGPSKRRRADNDSKLRNSASDGRGFASESTFDRKGKTREREQRDEDVKSESRRRRNERSPDLRGSHRQSRHREDGHRDRRSGSREKGEDRHRRHRERPLRENDSSRSNQSGPGREELHEAAISSNKDDASDSDPLDDIIGPAPPTKSAVRRRGRGANSAMSGIDGRFAADYDPTIDVSPEPDEAGSGDWDNAVEAFRDRQKWKQQGADRLRSAGFTEDQIRKWEKGDKKDESDVQWNKAGGVREWDRGKAIDLDDDVAPEPEFGRLKGT